MTRGGNRAANVGAYGSGARAVKVSANVSPLMRECIEYLAYREGVTVSAWITAACRERAIAQGGDPDTGAP